MRNLMNFLLYSLKEKVTKKYLGLTADVFLACIYIFICISV